MVIEKKVLVEASVLEPGIDIEENTTCAPESFSFLPRAPKSLLIRLGLLVVTSLVPPDSPGRQSGLRSEGCTKLLSHLVTSLIWTPGRQKTSLKRVWSANECLSSAQGDVTNDHGSLLFLPSTGLSAALPPLLPHLALRLPCPEPGGCSVRAAEGVSRCFACSSVPFLPTLCCCLPPARNQIPDLPQGGHAEWACR